MPVFDAVDGPCPAMDELYHVSDEEQPVLPALVLPGRNANTYADRIADSIDASVAILRSNAARFRGSLTICARVV